MKIGLQGAQLISSPGMFVFEYLVCTQTCLVKTYCSHFTIKVVAAITSSNYDAQQSIIAGFILH
jgi:hypothetical protein